MNDNKDAFDLWEWAESRSIGRNRAGGTRNSRDYGLSSAPPGLFLWATALGWV
jgi:hypothetical protein